MITIYADGSGWKGLCAWGYVIDYESATGNYLTDSGWSYGTNNVGELMAPLCALNRLEGEFPVIEALLPVTVKTDSKYVIRCIESYGVWKIIGWKTSEGLPIKNQELIQQLWKRHVQYKVDWVWVPGHAGIVGNEMADKLANDAYQKAKLLAGSPLK